MDYKHLLKNTDMQAQQLYPRMVKMPAATVEPYSGRPIREHLDTDPLRSATAAVGTVQQTPTTISVKRYVIIDTAQRDWIKQPNPYSNLIYTFGSQTQLASNPPVYSNNPFVPSFATDSNGNLNSVPGAPNTRGWYFSNAFFPAYNSSIPNGTFIGYDNGYLIQPSGYGFGSVFTPCNVAAIRLIRAILPQRQFLNLPIVPSYTTIATTSLAHLTSNSTDGVTSNGIITYTTQIAHDLVDNQIVNIVGYTGTATPYNFSSIAVTSIPSLTSFTVSTNYSNATPLADSTANIPVSVTGLGEFDSNGIIQKTLVGKPYSTFATYPYLLLYLNQYFGQYTGGNEALRKCFSVMTQKTRTQTNFQIDVGVQHYDYEPWGEEALHLQSPITNLQQLQLNVTDPIGTPFVQNDGFTVSLVQGDSNGSLFLKCFTGSYQYFTSNDLRVGDRITFDTVTLNNMLKSAILTSQGKKAYISAIISNTFPVLELLDYAPDSNGIYAPRTAANARTVPYNTSYNGFLIPNIFTSDAQGNVKITYSNVDSSMPYTCLDPVQLVGSNLPFLNVSLQPVFTFELECKQPDTGSIGGQIVL